MVRKKLTGKPRCIINSDHVPDVCVADSISDNSGNVFEPMQLFTLWENGDKETVRNYVKEHYLNSSLQIWLMRTCDVELIMTYLRNHPDIGLFEDAEELLMTMHCPELRRTYIEQWRLRHSSLLLLFAEKEFALLRRYVVKHPEECFSRMLLLLMFEMGDKKLIRQYVRTHPSILKEERYADKLRDFGLINSVSFNS